MNINKRRPISQLKQSAHSQLIISLIMFLLLSGCTFLEKDKILFDSTQAYLFVEEQLGFGPRFPGSSGHKKTQELIADTLNQNNWVVASQKTEYLGFPITNIIGKKGSGNPWIILGVHYDTREFADQDLVLANRNKPVPGANDGASGVGILLELSRVLTDFNNKTIWLVFFDQEDNGRIDNREWILGSRSFVENLETMPDKVVILDMVGDQNLNIHYEKNSDPEIMESIWNIASNLGYAEYFLPEYRFSMLDDHTPFVQAGVPSIDIIDFDYPYWHTTQDTIDKISIESLGIVGNTIQKWIDSIGN